MFKIGDKVRWRHSHNRGYRGVIVNIINDSADITYRYAIQWEHLTKLTINSGNYIVLLCEPNDILKTLL